MTSQSVTLDLAAWRLAVNEHVTQGQRLIGLFGTDSASNSQNGTRSCQLTALFAYEHTIAVVATVLAAHSDGILRYPALSPTVPAAFWYERALHDLSGVLPEGHPRLDPLLLDRRTASPIPAPGAATEPGLEPPVTYERQGPVDVAGHGMFTLPLGPVRSGVFESIEFLIETPGEDIPHLNVRPHYKHRGIAKQFEGRTPAAGVLVAERVEGISSIAHALAFSHAVEELAGCTVAKDAALVRVVLAELERMANHLDVTMRLADAAGLAVATSRFGWHKEYVQRLLSTLGGSRFGRGVVGIGGLGKPIDFNGIALHEAMLGLQRRIHTDVRALEASASFLDRLRGTGPLPTAAAETHGALGPIGRGSGVDNDVRRERPYDAYPELDVIEPPYRNAGDVLARTRVRWHELSTSTALIAQAAAELQDIQVRQAPEQAIPDGFAIGSAEAAQGEVVHAVEIADGVVRRCFARSASFHNLMLFHDVFAGDVFTDLPFIEASFGLGYAAVSM